MGKKIEIILAISLGFLLSLISVSFIQRTYDLTEIDKILFFALAIGAFSLIIKCLIDVFQRKSHIVSNLRRNTRIPDIETIKLLFFQNSPGLLVALVFIIVYLIIGSIFNAPQTAAIDNYMNADNLDWIMHIADPSGYLLIMRMPHPFALFLFRPIGWFLNFFFNDPYHTASFLNALAGGLSVFLAWLFIKTQSGSRIHALLVAILIGVSTAHLVFGSIVETYIFSATLLIAFFLLLLRNASDSTLTTISLLSLGLTITNFVQTFIGFVVSRPRWKEIIHFTGIVLSLGFIFTLIHALWYPSSNPFFLISSFKGENTYTFSILSEPFWNTYGRIILLLRTMLLYSVIAPLPYVVEGALPSFQFFRWENLHKTYLYSEYDGLGNILVYVWVGLLFFAGFSILLRFYRNRRIDLSFAFIGCLVFNFLLHCIYGDDPILYSPNWTFALIFFISIGMGNLAKSRISQFGLLIFVLLVIYNQWQFIIFLIDTVSSNMG